MNILEHLPNIIKNITSFESLQILSDNYMALGPFLIDMPIESLLEKQPVILCKVLFTLKRYKEAINIFKSQDISSFDDFFVKRMMYWSIENKCIGEFNGSLNSLGYILDNKIYELINEYLSFDELIYNACTKDATILEHINFNRGIELLREEIKDLDRINGNLNTYIKLKIDFYVIKNDLDELYEVIKVLDFPENYESCFYIFDNYPIISFRLAGHFSERTTLNGSMESQPSIDGKVVEILDGTFVRKATLDFLVKNNKTDFNFLHSLCKPLGEDKKIITLLSNAVMNMGTSNDSLYRMNLDILANVRNWCKFIGTSALGMIHYGIEDGIEMLQHYLPNENDLKRGGSLLGLGFVNKSMAKEEDLMFFHTFLTDEDLSGEIKFGASLGLGLIGMGTKCDNANDVLVKCSKNSDDLVFREGILLALGMINMGGCNEFKIENLNLGENETSESNVEESTDDDKLDSRMGSSTRTYESLENSEDKLKSIRNLLLTVCKQSEHERESRFAGIGLAVSLIKSKIDYNLIDDKNDVVRYTNALVLGASFVGTEDLVVISKLLLIMKDINDDVKMAAVVGIGLVCCTNQKLLLSTLKPLASNYNYRIRGTIGLVLGFFYCGSGNIEVSEILEALLYDSSDLVKQQAGLGLGLLLVGCNRNINCNYPRIIEKMSQLLECREDNFAVKFGMVIGRSLMEAAGTNCIFSVLSMSGRVEESRVVGALLFFQYWHFYPLFPFITLCMKPTGLFVFDSELNVVDFKVEVKKKKSEFDYERIRILPSKRSRRFKRKVEVVVEEPKVVEEADFYEISTGQRLSQHEMKEIGKKDFTFKFSKN